MLDLNNKDEVQLNTTNLLNKFRGESQSQGKAERSLTPGVNDKFQHPRHGSEMFIQPSKQFSDILSSIRAKSQAQEMGMEQPQQKIEPSLNTVKEVVSDLRNNNDMDANQKAMSSPNFIHRMEAPKAGGDIFKQENNDSKKTISSDDFEKIRKVNLQGTKSQESSKTFDMQDKPKTEQKENNIKLKTMSNLSKDDLSAMWENVRRMNVKPNKSPTLTKTFGK
jgi:hypothetical protein